MEKQEKKAGLFLLEQCRKKGLHIEILINEDSAFNFVASLYPLSDNKPNIIFLNHIDIVPPGDTSLWIQNPYSGIIDKNNNILGRGSFDNKGMAVAQLYAIAQFVQISREEKLPYNISLLCVSGEETGGYRGARLITERFLPVLNPLIVLGEGGTGVKNIIRSDPEKIVFGISSIDKIKLGLDLKLRINSPGHGSLPAEEYAMKDMVIALDKLLKRKPSVKYNSQSVKAVKEMGKYEKGIGGFVQRNLTFFVFRPLVKREIKKNPLLVPLFANTIALTRIITSENALNQIAQEASAVLDCRLIPGTSTERFIRQVKRRLDDKRIATSIIFDNHAGERTTNPYYYSYLCEAIKQVYPEAVIVDIIFPASTDNTYFRSRGIPSFGLFPACFEKEEMEGVHNINERINIERIDKGITIYKIFIETVLKQGSISAKK